jgi:hypothetical protein
MERRLKRMEWAGFFVCLGLGVLLHFLYEWSGYNPAAALIAPVNESLWEHGKLYTVPVLLWTAVEAAVVPGALRPMLPARAAALYLMVAGTFVGYYVYTGAVGRNVDWMNIALYVLLLATGFLLSGRLVRKPGIGAWGLPAVFLLLLLVGLQLNLTTNPPEWGLFRDPATGGYGVPAALPGSAIPV